MRLISKADLIATVAERYREAYLRRSGWLQPADASDPAAIYEKLAALPRGATEADVLAIVDDSRWLENICDECHQDRAVTVLMAEEIHHPTDAVTLCPDCLRQAVELAAQ